MKKLITERIVEEFLKGNSKKFRVDRNTLITPSAKDLARKEGVEFVCGKSNDAGACCGVNKDEEVCGNNNVTSENKVCTDEKKSCADEKEHSAFTEKERKMVVAAIIEVLKEKGLLK